MSYEENMNAILNLPIVKELMKKNKKLQKKNKALRNLMYSLPEFRCNCHINCCGQNKVRPLFEQTVEFVDKVFIKKEPGADEIRELNALVDDEVVILDKNPNDKPNIVYEIEETEEVVEEEEEVVEEDAGEVYEINISGKSYYVTNEKNGKIYAIDNNEDVGDEIGEYINGNVNFYKK